MSVGELVLREEDHTYWLRGQRVPGVTECLKPLTDYSKIPADTLARAQAEGVAVHRMVDLYCRNDLDEVPEWMAGHFEAWKKFLAESRFDVWASESRVWHPKICYAGTLDLVGMFRDGDYAGEPSIVDVKRSFYAGRAIGCQIAAYQHAWNDSLKPGDMRKVSGRYALQLRPDGTYRLRPFTDKSDWTTFLACLTLWRARIEIHQEAQPA